MQCQCLTALKKQPPLLQSFWRFGTQIGPKKLLLHLHGFPGAWAGGWSCPLICQFSLEEDFFFFLKKAPKSHGKSQEQSETMDPSKRAQCIFPLTEQRQVVAPSWNYLAHIHGWCGPFKVSSPYPTPRVTTPHKLGEREILLLTRELLFLGLEMSDLKGHRSRSLNKEQECKVGIETWGASAGDHREKSSKQRRMPQSGWERTNSPRIMNNFWMVAYLQTAQRMHKDWSRG